MSVDQVQRKFPRFETDVRISFSVPYEFRTEVDFKLDSEAASHQEHKYIGFSKNISVNGLCFESPKELKNGDKLWIELHLPKCPDLIYMEGEVRWSRLISAVPNTPHQYATGVIVRKVDGSQIDETVYFDETYKVMWSQLLERVLGGFARLNKKK
ncbi:MAG: PilZ domain-containing protein [Candidatus Omnitrophica bacterium]|nr:PilZ domain-containing protein [Candidatus Omnitrophota bacterium]